jgi:hypothetical protein
VDKKCAIFSQMERVSDRINSINASNPNFRIIPGEEVSVDNGLGRNVPLGVLNNPSFSPALAMVWKNRAVSHPE